MSHPPAPAGPPRHHQQHHPHHHSPQDAVPPPAQHYQPVSYSSPAPHHYAAHTAPPPPQYAYPSPGGQSVDQYRQSPTGPPPHQLALPSMRSFDPQGQQQQPQSPHAQQPQPQQHHAHHHHHHQQQQQQQQHAHHPPYSQVQHHPQQQQPQPPPPQHHHPSHYQPHMHHMAPGGPMGSTMAPAPHMSYFSIQPQPYALHDPMLRYNLSQGIFDPRMQLSGGRHKKEIKRRTKTGCLTCRKRRIKCDETHPTCNNCKKSKRECLGYDPIFKQQQQQQQQQTSTTTTTTLQTATNGDVSPPTSTTNATAPSTTTAPAPYTTHPTPILTPSESPSAPREHCDDKLTSHIKYEELELERTSVNIDPTLPSTYSLAGPNNNNNNNNSTHHHHQHQHQHQHHQQQHHHHQQHHNTNGNAANSASSADYLTQKPGEALHLRGGGSPFSFASPSAALPSSSPSPLLPSPSLPHHSPSPAGAHAYTNASVKMKVDDIVASFAAPLPETGLMPTPQSVDELTKVYYELYVPGLCHFFETDWFNFRTEGHNPVTIFLHNRPLISLLGSFLVSLHTVNAEPAHTAYCANLEMRVVWALTKLAYVVPLGTNMPRDDPLPDDNASEIRNRVWVFETLLSGTELAANPLIPPPKNGDAQQRKEFDFWHCLAEFLVRQQGMTLVQQSAYRQQLLQKMRTLLDGRENRDLLYSMAIIRHWTPEVEPGWEDKVPDHLDEKDPVNQLHVAIQFVKAESSPAGGTTNVVRHLAFLAARALIHPGCNVFRKA